MPSVAGNVCRRPVTRNSTCRGTSSKTLKAGDGISRLSHFEVRYRTKGDFEIMVFKQLENNAIAAAIEGGFFDRSRLYLTIDDLTKLRWMISQAKDQLDELK